MRLTINIGYGIEDIQEFESHRVTLDETFQRGLRCNNSVIHDYSTLGWNIQYPPSFTINIDDSTLLSKEAITGIIDFLNDYQFKNTKEPKLKLNPDNKLIKEMNEYNKTHKQAPQRTGDKGIVEIMLKSLLESGKYSIRDFNDIINNIWEERLNHAMDEMAKVAEEKANGHSHNIDESEVEEETFFELSAEGFVEPVPKKVLYRTGDKGAVESLMKNKSEEC